MIQSCDYIGVMFLPNLRKTYPNLIMSILHINIDEYHCSTTNSSLLSPLNFNTHIMKTIEAQKVVREYWDAISGKAKPIELLKKYVSDDEFINHIKVYEESFPHYELIAEDYICENDKVVVRARVKGVHKGELMGMPPTGKTIDLPFVVIYKVDEDKIVKGWLSVDRVELMDQLGFTSMN